MAARGALVRKGQDKRSEEVATLGRGAEAWGDSIAWEPEARVRLAWPVKGWASLRVFEPFRVADRKKCPDVDPAECACEADEAGDWWAALKFSATLDAMPRLPAALEGDRGEWVDRGDVALGAGYLADAVGRYSRAIVCASVRRAELPKTNNRGDAAAATRIVRGDVPRPRRGSSVETNRHDARIYERDRRAPRTRRDEARFG